MEWQFYTHLVIYVGGVLIIIAVLNMLLQRRTPTSITAWLLAMFIVPFFALPLYFIIGIRKRKNFPKKTIVTLQKSQEIPINKANPIDLLLRKNNIPGTTEGNKFILFTDSIKAYNILMLYIKEAKESISISMYILSNDKVSKSIIDALTLKAKEGVRVRILIDSVGSFFLYFNQIYLRKLKKAGGSVSFFMPIFKQPLQNYINLRNHRKILIFDDQKVLSGGMNISRKYMGPDFYEKRWQDLFFSIEGAAVYHYKQVFEQDWAYATDTSPKEVVKEVKVNISGDGIQVVPSGPDIKNDALYEALIGMIHMAKERVWIVTPYFVPDNNLLQALIIANHKGVDVKLITPKESNHIIVDLCRSSYMRELEEKGIDVMLYKGNMLHAKAILFDNIGVMVGSANIDNRSLFLNYEIVNFVYSKEVIKDIESWMQTLLLKSTRTMDKAKYLRRIGENLMKIFAPLV
ncbi:MAG: cardiolipin synthase [Arcobacteraceae bacterium]|nr:cardiolipin synthase [Arcobacteraceae bacterium]